eukprot:s171_g8.t1
MKSRSAEEIRGIVATAQQIDTEMEFDPEQPDAAEVTETMKERARAMLTRLHKAAGHPSNRALARICRDRGMPRWVVTEALNLHCQACLEARRGGTMQVPHSVGSKPAPWQMLGMDVFEVFFPQQKRKARYLLAICMVMRLTMVEMLWEGPMNEAGTDSGQKMVDVFASSWLQHRPEPEWILTDPQSSLAKGEFAEFCGWIGCGLATMPGEAHWQNGAVETAVKAIKKTMRRLRNESSELSPRLCGHLAASAHNQNDGVKGFSPVQWAFGSNPATWNKAADPLEVNRNQGERPAEFWRLQRWRAKAEEIHRQELARETFARLHNAAPRPVVDFQPGDCWARFIGPGLVALLEPPVLPDSRVSVIWVLVGTSLWRCAPEQLRMASEQEVITELLEKGKAVIEEVMKGLRRFVDVAREHDPGDQDGLPPEPWLDGAAEPEPGEAEAQPPQQWEDTLENAADEWAARRAASREREARRPSRSRTPEGPAARTTVREQIEQWQQMASANAARKLEGLPRMRRMPEDIEFGEVPDTWEIDEENRMLIRHHHGDPNRIGNCPVPMDQFTGKRVTIWTTPRGSTGSFVDQWIGTRTDPERQHHNRWKGSTHLEIKEGYDVLAPKRQEKVTSSKEEAMVVEFDVEDLNLFVASSTTYAKTKLASNSAAKEVSCNLDHKDRARMDEAMAREISEVLRSQAIKAAAAGLSEEQVRDRLIPMRWILTWKPVPDGTPPERNTNEVASADGKHKAKARIVLIGYKHPDLARRNARTGQPELLTASPTLSRLGRNMLLQAAAFDQHSLPAGGQGHWDGPAVQWRWD